MYAAQIGVAPPSFVFFTNVATTFHFSYERFLINKLREHFGFVGTPIRIQVRRRAKSMPRSQRKPVAKPPQSANPVETPRAKASIPTQPFEAHGALKGVQVRERVEVGARVEVPKVLEALNGRILPVRPKSRATRGARGTQGTGAHRRPSP